MHFACCPLRDETNHCPVRTPSVPPCGGGGPGMLSSALELGDHDHLIGLRQSQDEAVLDPGMLVLDLSRSRPLRGQTRRKRRRGGDHSVHAIAL